MADKENKKAYSFKFYKNFKDQMDVVANHEGITTTALIEREVGRYIRLMKLAALENQRKSKIIEQLNQEKKSG